MNNTIEIKGRKYLVKETLRAILDYEKDANKRTVDTLTDEIKMFYYVLKNANRKKTDEHDKFTIGFEAFIDAIDDDMSILTSLGQGEVNEDGDKKK